MKKIYVLVCGLLASIGSYCQDIEWIRQFSFSDWIHLTDIVTYKDHIYLTGVYEGRFGSGHPAGSFLHKLDLQGHVLWERRDTLVNYTWLAVNSAGVYFMESDKTSGRSFLEKLDDKDNTVSRIEASGKVDVDRQGNAFMLSGNWLRKHSPSGSLVWSYAIGDNIQVKDLKTDPAGNVVIAGAISNPYSNTYVAKISPAGKRLWALNGQGGNHYGNTCNAVSIDEQGDVYTTGSFSESIAASSWSLSGGLKNTFTLKISSDGVYRWLENENLDSFYDVSIGVDIVNDRQGNVYVVRNAGYILKYDTDGTLKEHYNIAAAGYEGAATIKKAAMYNNMLLVVGSVFDEAEVGKTHINSKFLNDLFIAGLKQEEAVLSSGSEPPVEAPGLYPNPSSGLFKVRELPGQGKGASIRVTDPQGKVVRQLNFTNMPPEVSIDLTNESKGMYFMEFITEGERLNRKILVE